MITVDLESPCLTGLVPSRKLRIGTEYLGDSVFEEKGGNREKVIRVDIYAPKQDFLF